MKQSPKCSNKSLSVPIKVKIYVLRKGSQKNQWNEKYLLKLTWIYRSVKYFLNIICEGESLYEKREKTLASH